MRLSASKSSASSFYSGLGEQLYDLSGARPALDLNFASNGSLVDSVTGKNLVTHTRASNATYVDGDGIIKDAVTNLLLRSEEFDNAGWSKTGSSVDADQIAAPDGTLTADKIIEGTSAGVHRVFQDLTSTVGLPYTFSFYAKAAERTWLSVELRATGSLGTFNVNLATGETSGSTTGQTITTTSVGNDWWRIVIADSAADDSGAGNVLIYCNNGSSNVYTGDGTSGIYVWGAQLEQSSTAGEYVKTTSTINSAPRFDHNPTTGESLGLLIEEARTNLVPSSNGFGSFSVSDASRQSGHTGPDGSQDAYKITSTTSTTYSRIFTFHNSTAGTVVTFSVYLKVDSGSLSQQACIALGSTAVYATKNITLTTNWQRFDITGTVPSDALEMANPLIYLNPDDDSGAAVTDDYLYIFGAQLEVGSFPTSYIRTSGSTATRSADVASITGTNFSSWYNQTEGTFYAEGNSFGLTTSTFPTFAAISDGTTNNRLQYAYITGALGGYLVRSGGSGVVEVYPSITANPRRAVFASKADDYAVSYNGAAPAIDTSGAMPVAVNQMQIGNLIGAGATNNFFGTLKRLIYWPTRLSNDTLQTITR